MAAPINQKPKHIPKEEDCLPTSGTSDVWKLCCKVKEVENYCWCKSCAKWYATPDGFMGNLIKHCNTQHNMEIIPAKLNPKESILINETLVKMMISCNLSFLSVEDVSFKNFVENLCSLGNKQFKIPCRQTIASLIDKMYEDTVKHLVTKISSMQYVSLTADSATIAPSNPFTCLTVHYIDNDWKLCSNVASITFLPGSQTAVILENVFQDLIAIWNLSGRIIGMTTDGGKNYCRMLQSICDVIPEPLRCSCHTLQLVINKALDMYDSLILKCRKLVIHFKRSALRVQKLRLEQRYVDNDMHFDDIDENDELKMNDEAETREPILSLQLNNNTRWNSKWKMMKRLVKLKEFVVKIYSEERPVRNPILSEDEWYTITLIVEILDIFAPATEELQYGNKVNVSLLLPILSKLTSRIASVDVVLNPSLAQFVSQLHEGIQSQFWNIPDCIYISTLLDPRFKDLSFLSTAHKEKCYRLLQAKVNENQERVNIPPPAKRTKLETLLGSSQSLLSNEIQRYSQIIEIALPDDPLQWWKQNQQNFPILSKLAKKYLSMPISSAPSERVWSITKYIVGTTRQSLLAEKVAKLSFLKCNINEVEISHDGLTST